MTSEHRNPVMTQCDTDANIENEHLMLMWY